MAEKNTEKETKKAATPKVTAKKAVAPKVKEAAKTAVKAVKKVVEKATKADEAPTKEVKAKAPAKKAVKKVSAQRKLATVELNYFSPASASVEVAGTFNDWKPAAMKKAKDGVWSIKLELEPGNYEYKLVFDKTSWEVDSGAPTIQSDLGVNNILQVH